MFLAGQASGPPVRIYLHLLNKVHAWARQGINPVAALEDIEHCRVRSLGPHPATIENRELAELANDPSPFEEACKHLAPQIRRKNGCDQDTAEDDQSLLTSTMSCSRYGMTR